VSPTTSTARAFRDNYGRDPEVAWRSPGRVNLIGEHTDYSDGLVLPLALALDTRVEAARRDDRMVRVSSVQHADTPPAVMGLADLTPGSVTGWAAYVAGTAWALQQAGIDLPGADLMVDGTVPSGAGLSSSASLECATAGALLALAGADLPLLDVALLARQAENDYVGVPCGVMDQLASTFARAGHLMLIDTRTLAVQHIPFDLARVGLTLLVVDTRAPHELVAGEYADRRASCEEAARRLGIPALRDVTDLDAALATLDDPTLRRRVRHVVTENQRVVDVVDHLGSEDVRGIGPLLTASHASLRDDYRVSSRELDLAVDTALAAGALGARMTGGGFGGSAIALVEADAAGDTRAQITAAFRSAGLAGPGFVGAEPGDGYGPAG
jgi:galactokinase